MRWAPMEHFIIKLHCYIYLQRTTLPARLYIGKGSIGNLGDTIMKCVEEINNNKESWH